MSYELGVVSELAGKGARSGFFDVATEPIEARTGIRFLRRGRTERGRRFFRRAAAETARAFATIHTSPQAVPQKFLQLDSISKQADGESNEYLCLYYTFRGPSPKVLLISVKLSSFYKQ